MTTIHVCARCGLKVRHWYYGWKHSGGWHTPPSCGRRPLPVLRDCAPGR